VDVDAAHCLVMAYKSKTPSRPKWVRHCLDKSTAMFPRWLTPPKRASGSISFAYRTSHRRRDGPVRHGWRDSETVMALIKPSEAAKSIPKDLLVTGSVKIYNNDAPRLPLV
jgi:hypothetical protein